jgi:pyruvate dehydrogenase E2 component (dihydrolipoamide acetyltransferase)
MAYLVKMPSLGMEMQEGEVIEWHVSEDETVEEGDLIAEIEAEKNTADINAREDGVLRHIYVEVGGVVEPGTPIGLIAEADEDIADLEAQVEQDAGADEETATETEGETPDESRAAAQQRSAQASSDDRIKATPKAKQRAGELGVDLATVDGTGPQGAITADDVEASSGSPAHSFIPREERTLSQMRRTITDRLGQSYQEAIHVTEHRAIVVDELLDAVDQARDGMDQEISLTDVLFLAVSQALAEHPEFNATYEDGVHRLYEEHNLCTAVDIDDGLIAPVVGDVSTMSLSDVATGRRETVEKAQSGQYTMDDLTGGTFTVTNLGMYGVDSFTPIINPPQIAILGVNRVRERAVPAADGYRFQSEMTVDLSFDHRVVDGADAAQFLQTLAETVSDAESYLPE